MAGLKTLAQSNVVVDARSASAARQHVEANGSATSAFGQLLSHFENAPPDSRLSSSIGTGTADDSTNPDENLAPSSDEDGAALLDAMLEQIVSGRTSNKAAVGAGLAPASGVDDQPDASNPDDRIRTLFANAIASVSSSLPRAPSSSRTPADPASPTSTIAVASVAEGENDPTSASQTPGVGGSAGAHRRHDGSKTGGSDRSGSDSSDGLGAGARANSTTAIVVPTLDPTSMAYMAAIQNQPKGSFGVGPTPPSVSSSTRGASTADPAASPQSNVFQDFFTAPDDAGAGAPDYSVDAVRTFLAVGSPAERFVAPESADAPALSVASANAPTSTRTEKLSREPRGRGATDAATPSSGATAPVHDDVAQAATGDSEREKHARTSDPAKQDSSSDSTSNDTTQPSLVSTPDLTGSGSSSAGVAFSVAASDLPGVIASLVDDQPAASGSSGPTGRSSGPIPPTAPGDTVVKELDLSLDPADLGKISVKLRSDGVNLSVVIEVQKREALKQVEAQKDLIAQRLGADGQTVSSVVVREAPAAAQASGGNEADGSTGAYAGGSNSNAEGSRGGGSNGSNGNLEHYDRDEDARRPDPPALDGNVNVRRPDGGIFF